MNKRDFQRLRTKYGDAAIASVMGVPQPTIRRWGSAGVPASRDKVLQSLETIRRHEGYEEKALREMMKLAKAEGKLPQVKNYSKKRDGEKTTGYEVSRKETGFLNEATLLKVRSHLEKERVTRGLPNWVASVTVSALVSESEKAGSGDVRFQVNHPEADAFVVESFISSGLRGSKKDMIDSVMTQLRQKMREGDRFFIHGSYMSTYEYKSERETLDLKRERRKRK